MYLGDFDTGAIFDKKFTTVRGDTGAPTTLAGTPAVKVYKGNSTTESTAGVTLSVDFDSVTGLNNLRIDTSADATFYAAGSNFQAVITAGTVNSVSVVGYVVCEFSIQNRSQTTALADIQAGVNILPTLDEIGDELETNRQIPAKLTNVPAQPTGVFEWNTDNLEAIIAYIGMFMKHKIVQTTTEQTVYADDGTTPVATATTSADVTQATRGVWVTST